MKILLMEDDAVLSDILLDYLREYWSVDYAFNSDEVYSLLDKCNYDLFIFDVNVTGKTGIKLLKELREYNNTTPCIVITAYRDTKHLQLAFDAGAHDYIKKPFELEELNARILNTQKLFNIEIKEEIEIDSNTSYLPKNKQILRDKNSFTLSSKDNAILSYFINNKNRAITNSELIQNIWDYENLPSDATIRSHIRTLREIIGKEKIRTLRGEGYIYE